MLLKFIEVYQKTQQNMFHDTSNLIEVLFLLYIRKKSIMFPFMIQEPPVPTKTLLPKTQSRAFSS